MAIVINGSGTISGISVGGLPDSIVDAGTLATNSVDSAELIDGAVDDSHMAAMAASKLTGALPAISGASLTGISDSTPAFYVYNTGNISVANNTNTILQPASEAFDTDNCYASGTGRFTPGVAGKYYLKAAWRIDSSQFTRGLVSIYKNGSADAGIKAQEYEANEGGSHAGGNTSAIVTSDADDYFTIYAYHNRGLTENVFDVVFMGFKISGT